LGRERDAEEEDCEEANHSEESRRWRDRGEAWGQAATMRDTALAIGLISSPGGAYVNLVSQGNIAI